MRRRLWMTTVLTLVALLCGIQQSGVATAEPPTSAGTLSSPTSGTVSASLTNRAAVLGSGWQPSSDALWNLVPSADGVAVMRAPFASGATWTEVATLRVANIASRQWIGQACLLPHSHLLAATYGPVEYISTATLFERGAFAALVNLDTGHVTNLPLRPTFSYFSPGCSASGLAAFTSFGADEATTSVSTVSVAGSISTLVKTQPGEFTDALATGSGIAAVEGRDIVRLQAGHVTTLFQAPSQISNLRTSSSGLVFQFDRRGKTEL
jgi:hypothetical protein